MGDEVQRWETHLEVNLDPEEDIASPREPIFVDVVTRDDDVRPIIPASLRGWANARKTVWFYTQRYLRVAAGHTVRSPWYLLLASFWAPVGVFRILGRQLAWWWVTEQSALRWEATKKLDTLVWMKLHKDVRAIRKTRGLWLLGEVGGVLVVVVLLVYAAPWWVAAAVLAVAVPPLAHVGRPATKPIVTPLLVTPRFRKLTADIVLRAYYAAGLGHPEKPGMQVQFGSTMSRDGEGSRVLVDLPYGKGLDDALKAKGAIASGLDVAISQVFITRDPTSNRRHVLWVADRDPLAIPAGRTPLLRLQPTDIWQPAPFGLDERGQLVTLPMMWTSILVGAQPRQGKSFAARLLALYAAMDPYVKLTVFDGKGSPDWRKFRLVADRCGFGLAMSRDGDPVELFLEALRELKADVQDRYQRLSELPVDVCPEGKLTREIARDPKYRMSVRLVVIDECQEYFDTGDKDVNKEIAALLVYLVKVAPAAGVIVLDATQKPGGVGTGDVATAFTSFRDNHQVRFALRTGSWQVSELVLGAGAYSEGFDSSTLLPQYKGVGILRGATDATPTVRTFLADAGDAERILTAARAYRERAGTLTGMAAGDDVARESRDVLRDVQGVFYAGEAWISWQSIASRLAEQLPQHYADATKESISAQVRALGAEEKKGRDKALDGQPSLWGVPLEQVVKAIQRREITGAR